MALRRTATIALAPGQVPPPGTVERKSNILEALSSRYRSSKKDEPKDDADELNRSLSHLQEVFPNVQPEVLREMISAVGKESLVQVVTENMLENRHGWIKGRWRNQTGLNVLREQDDITPTNRIPKQELFKSQEYKDAVQQALRTEFRGLRNSAISAVLAENNFSYSQSRPTLHELASKSWRVAVSSFLLRRKKPSQFDLVDPSSHPYVRRLSTSGFRIHSTGSAELDAEMHESLLAPIQRRAQVVQVVQDLEYANKLLATEAVTFNSAFECQICFGDYPDERMKGCDQNAHLICFTCIKHSVNAALFDQGWNSLMHMERHSLRCLTPGAEDCTGCIPLSAIREALGEGRGASKLATQLESRFARESLKQSSVPLVSCPFCEYAEVDEVYEPVLQQQRKFLPLSSVYSSNSWKLVFLSPFIAIMYCFLFLTFPEYLDGQIRASINRAARKGVSQRFQCRSPACGRASCMVCSKAWVDPHHCYQSERLAYEAYIDNFLTAAMKRTCPRCYTSFVKESGCNRMICPCGYAMCYVCRGQLDESKDAYNHFCAHFRALGGPCTKCEKCELWRVEEDKAALARARSRAEAEWVNSGGVVPGQLDAHLTTTTSTNQTWMRDYIDLSVERTLDLLHRQN
ncbi:MAG: hypothetical protein M1814_004694 [Vezdaea aestivalis]|nr:MAG: hypothetical protein M1814_004694 [Vezdaea aestivalis]